MTLVRRIGPTVLASKLRRRVWSTTEALVVRADTTRPSAQEPQANLSFETRPSASLHAIGDSLEHAEGAEYLYLRGLEDMRRSNPGSAIVAVAGGGVEAALLFVHDRETRDRLDRIGPGIYPPIRGDEVMTEGVYCWPEFRRQGVTTALLCETLRRLHARGTRCALAVIDADNVGSLRAFERAGYRPTGLLRVGRLRLGRWRSEWIERPERAQHLWQRATVR